MFPLPEQLPLIWSNCCSNPTLSLAPDPSGLFEGLLLKNSTPNAEQIVLLVVHRRENGYVTLDFFAVH